MSVAAIVNTFKFFRFFQKVFIESLEGGKSCRHTVYLFVDVWPGIFVDPGSGIGRHLNISWRTSQEKPELILSQSFVSKENFGRQHERENQFMLFEKRSTDVLVQRISEIVVHAVESFLEDVGRRWVLQAQEEEVAEPLQGILVHRVDWRKVQNTEIEQTSPKSDRSVWLSCFVDLSFSYLRVLHPLVDFLSELLTRLELVNQSLIH